MRATQLRALGAAAALAVFFAGCGGNGDQQAPEPIQGKVVSGETETGMKLKVETFVAPDDDEQLGKLEAFRALVRYPPVDYHRVTADNTAGSVADMGRNVVFADSANDVVASGGVPSRFSCDVLRYEWPVPPGASAEAAQAHDELTNGLCADGPPKPDGIAPGETKVYYVVTDRGFGERGIENKRIFGPLNAELRQP